LRNSAQWSLTVREGCAKALGEIGVDARGAVGALAKALKDKHAGTRSEAAEALRRMGNDASDAVPELEAVLGDKKEKAGTRARAAYALGQIGSDSRDAMKTLKEVLADPKAPAEVRKAVAQSLGRMGRIGAEAAETLAAVLTVKNRVVRPGKKPVLAEREVRLAALTTLDGLGGEARKALPGLIAATRDEDRAIRCLALHAIGTMGKEIEDHRKNAVKALWRCLRDSSIEVRVSAAEALGALGSDGLYTDTTETLKRLAAVAKKDGSKTVREAAKAAHDKIDPKKVKDKKEKEKEKE
jgi:HEAT repeat protein